MMNYEQFDRARRFYGQHRKYILITVLAVVVFFLIILIAVVAKRTTDSSQVNEDPQGYRLRHVVILSRHSLRAPSHYSEKWSNPEYYPMGAGYLTANGKKMALKVGSILRSFYKNFLSDSPRDIWVRSSSFPRAFESASLLLDTMFPPVSTWDFGYSRQPIPIIMLPEGNDIFIESCEEPFLPTFAQVSGETHAELEADGFKTAGDFLSWVTTTSGYPNNTSDFYWPIIDGLYCQKMDGHPVPSWVTEKGRAMSWAVKRLSYEIYNNSIPFYGEFISQKIATQLQTAVLEKTPKISLFMYHETNLQALLAALGLDIIELYPSFMGALHFQLYIREDDAKFYVRTIYSQGMTASGDYLELGELKLPSCKFPECSLEDFSKIMMNLFMSVDRRNCGPTEFTALL